MYSGSKGAIQGLRVLLGSSLGLLCSSTLKFHFTDMKTKAQRCFFQSDA